MLCAQPGRLADSSQAAVLIIIDRRLILVLVGIIGGVIALIIGIDCKFHSELGLGFVKSFQLDECLAVRIVSVWLTSALQHAFALSTWRASA